MGFKNRINWIIILGLSLLSLFFGLYKVNDRYEFNWDQEDDAIKVMGMIKDKKPLLIGPRVTHENSFFVGPYHYYFLLPFYGLMRGHPHAGIVAMIFVCLITTISMYMVASKLYGIRVGTLSGIFYIISQPENLWSAIYLPLLGIWGWWGVNKLSTNRHNVRWLLPLYGLSSLTHLVPVSMGIPILIAWLVSDDKKINIKDLMVGIMGEMLFLTPLVVFDLRHDFLNSRKIIEMFLGKTKIEREFWLPLKTYFRSLNLMGIKWLGYIFETAERWIVILIGLLEFLRLKKDKEKLITSIWVLTPLIAMFAYGGGVSEYYYAIALVVITVFLAKFVSRQGRYTTIIVIAFLTINNFFRLNQTKSNTSLKNKLEIATYLVNQRTDPVFNLSYELPLGWDNGFSYLFDYLGKKPQNIPEGHLYTIMLDRDEEAKTGETVARSGVFILKRR